jgi:archaellum component FlaC
MKTENRIFANLQKFKSQKQNLGAIEDAIEEQKGLAFELSNKMNDVYRQLENQYASTLDAISSDVDNLASIKTSLVDEYNRYYEQYWELADALIQYSNWNTDIVDELNTNWTDMTDNIDNLENSITQSIRF